MNPFFLEPLFPALPQCVEILEVVIPGQPVGKGRPVFAKRGKFVSARTPDKTLAWEHGAEMRIRDVWRGAAPLDQACSLRVEAVCRRPQALVPKVGPRIRTVQPRSGRLPCLAKPDIDNVIKIAMDALVLAHVLTDDTRVVEVSGRKVYAAIGEQEHVRIVLTALSFP